MVNIKAEIKKFGPPHAPSRSPTHNSNSKFQIQKKNIAAQTGLEPVQKNRSPNRMIIWNP